MRAYFFGFFLLVFLCAVPSSVRSDTEVQGSPASMGEAALADAYARLSGNVDDQLVLPVVHMGLDLNDSRPSSLAGALKAVASKIYSLYRSAWYRGFMYWLLVLCGLIGSIWLCVDVMAGRSALRDVVWWGSTRFTALIIGVYCFSPRFVYQCCSWINTVAEMAVTSVSPMLVSDVPAVVPADWRRVFDNATRENELWLKAALEYCKTDVALKLGRPSAQAAKRDKDDVIENVADVFIFGFPIMSYDATHPRSLEGQLVRGWWEVDAFTGSYSNFYVPSPMPDKYPLTIQSEGRYPVFNLGYYYRPPMGRASARLTAPLTRDIYVRSVLQGFAHEQRILAERMRLLALERAGQPEDAGVVESTSRSFYEALDDYQLVTAAIRKTWVVDYISFSYVTLGRAPGMGTESADFGQIAGEEGLTRVSNDHRNMKYISERYLVILADIETVMSKVRKAAGKFSVDGFVMNLLIPVALALVSFYVVISVYFVPSLLLLWVALFFLPKELEVSGALRKGAHWVLTLFFLPVFVSVIVAVATGLVEVAKVLAMTTELRLIGSAGSALIGGMVGGTVAGAVPLPDVLGIFKMGATLLGASNVGFASLNNANWNLVVWVSWLVAFLLILGSPKIVAGLLSGAGTIGDAMVQRLQAGAFMGGGLAMMGGMRTASAISAVPKAAQGVAGMVATGGAAGGAGAAAGAAAAGSGGSGGSGRKPGIGGMQDIIDV
jgi:hypothetical protein